MMNETPDKEGRDSDALAEIIRAAGMRATPPREHYESVYAATRAAWKRSLRARRQRRWLALAASFGVIALGAAMLQTILPGDLPPAASVAIVRGPAEWIPSRGDAWAIISGSGIRLNEGARIRTGSSGRLSLALADGGSLRMHGSTEIELGREAIALADGRLYFDSDGRPDRLPITIGTSHGSVRDIGTQFEVSMSASDLRIRVRSGEIALLDSTADEDLVGAIGEEILLAASGDWTSRPLAPDDPEWAWTEELAVVPMSRYYVEYFEWIARETGKQLVFEPTSVESSARNITFNGNPEGLNPLELLEQITATSNFNYALPDDGTLLIRRE